jgi:hypothetical protein
LEVTPFIIAKGPDTGTPNYRKPNELYFETKKLHLYFEGNDSYTFVNLDEYPDTARTLLENLGVLDFVRVKRRDRDPQGHVVIHNSHGWHRRGLDGFDPGIDVDGLEYAINNPTLQKSEFIWNAIALPNADCIRGFVEKSTKKTYEDSTTEEVTDCRFNLLLTAENAWLPDSAGNMHKPCKLTLDDLPESFERNEQLANQLGMKRNEVAEFAEKNGVSVEAIRSLIQNPEEYEEFKAWKAAKTSTKQKTTDVETNYPHEGTQDIGLELQGEDDLTRPELSTPLPRLSSEYTTEDIALLNENLGEFQKWKVTKANGNNPTFPDKSVADPERRKTKLDEELKNLPKKEYDRRMRSDRVTAATKYTRAWLKVNYTNDDEQMVCQICESEMPFKKRDGDYYFEAVEAFTNEYFTTEHEAQFLALCPECASRYKEFVKRNDATIQAIINQLMGSNSLAVPLKLGELDTNLRFVERHWLAIKEILKKSI